MGTRSANSGTLLENVHKMLVVLVLLRPIFHTSGRVIVEATKILVKKPSVTWIDNLLHNSMLKVMLLLLPSIAIRTAFLQVITQDWILAMWPLTHGNLCATIVTYTIV